MSSKTKIILLIIGAILILVGFAVLLFRPSDAQIAQNTAEKFAAEFATYKYSEPNDYRDRVGRYLSDDYKELFFEKYSLEGGSGEALKGYQTVLKMVEIKQTGFRAGVSADFEVSLELERLEPPEDTEPKQVTTVLKVSLVKTSDKWLVSGITPEAVN